MELDRDFFDICDRVVDAIEVADPDLLDEVNKVFIYFRFPCDLREIIVEHCSRLIYDNYFDQSEMDDFMDGIKEIENTCYHTAPEDHSILWNKLCRLCAIYVHKYRDTEWAQKISRIIRGLE